MSYARDLSLLPLLSAITPQKFGARGDGASNDHAAMVLALAASAARPLHFPRGTYLVAGDLTIPAGAVITADEGAEIKLISGSSCSHVLKCGSSGAFSTAKVTNLTINGNKAGSTTIADAGFVFERPYRFYANNFRVMNCPSDGVLLGVSGTAFENYLTNLSSYNNDGFGVRMLGSITDTHLFGGDIGYNALGGVKIGTSCTIKGATIWGGGLSNSIGVTTAGNNILIENCNIEGHGQHGAVVSTNNLGVDFIGNRFYANSFTAANTGLYDGIYINTGTSGSVISNVFRGALSSGSPYSMRYAVNFAGSHSPWTLMGNDMPNLIGGNPVTAKTSGPVVNGILQADISDFNWVGTRVLVSAPSNFSPAAAFAWEKVGLSTVAADTLSEWTTGGTFTPKNSGSYRIDIGLVIDPNADQEQMGLSLFTAAGVEVRRIAFTRSASASTEMLCGNIVEFLTAGTAYELRWLAGSTSSAAQAGSTFTYAKIRPSAN